MTLKRTTWRPDTCGCRVEFEVDTDFPDVIVPLWKATKDTCPEHTGFVGQALYERILAENRQKNVAFTLARGIDVDLTVNDFKWSFNDKRELSVSLPTFNPAKKTDLQSAYDLQFGSGIVTVI